MRPSDQFIVLFLKGIVLDSRQTGRPLVEFLEIAARGQLVDGSNGGAKVLAGTGADGTAVTITLPPRGSLRGLDLAKMAGVLLTRVRELRTAEPAMHDDRLACFLMEPFRTKRAA